MMKKDIQLTKKIMRHFESDTAWRSPENPHLFYLRHEKQEIVKMFPKSVNVSLDLGAGRGRFSKELAKIGNQAVALDISRNMLKSMQQKTSRMTKSNVYYVRGSADSLPFSSNSFDLVIAVEVIGYVINFKKLLGEISRVLRSDGFLIISQGNILSFQHIVNVFTHVYRQARRYGLKSGLKALLNFVKGNRIFQILTLGFWISSYFSLQKSLKQAGFRVSKVSAAGFLDTKLLTMRKAENLSSRFPFKYFSRLCILSVKKSVGKS